MTRIISGQARGRRLKAPAGAETRPTGDRVKQTLFDILAPDVPGCAFLDLFAGSGSIGLEALSRGAARVVLVDQSAAAIRAVRENVATLGSLGGEVQVFRQDAATALAGLVAAGARFDLVYLDPPYQSDAYEPLLAELGEGALLSTGLAVAEHFHKRALPETIGRLVRVRSVRVGDHTLSFYRHASQQEHR